MRVSSMWTSRAGWKQLCKDGVKRSSEEEAMQSSMVGRDVVCRICSRSFRREGDKSVWMRGGNLLVNREELPNVKYVETGIEAEEAWSFTHADLLRGRGQWIIHLTRLLPFGHERPQCGSVKTRQDKLIKLSVFD